MIINREWLGKLQELITVFGIIAGCRNNSTVNCHTFKRLLGDIMKYFMPVNMTIYMKLLPN